MVDLASRVLKLTPHIPKLYLIYPRSHPIPLLIPPSSLYLSFFASGLKSKRNQVRPSSVISVPVPESAEPKMDDPDAPDADPLTAVRGASKRDTCSGPTRSRTAKQGRNQGQAKQAPPATGGRQ